MDMVGRIYYVRRFVSGFWWEYYGGFGGLLVADTWRVGIGRPGAFLTRFLLGSDLVVFVDWLPNSDCPKRPSAMSYCMIAVPVQSPNGVAQLPLFCYKRKESFSVFFVTWFRCLSTDAVV